MTHNKNNVVDFKRPEESRGQVLERLFNEHGAALRSFLRARLGAADVEDVVQEVFVRLARMTDLDSRLPAGGKENRAYIFMAANNMIVDMERRKAVRRRHQEDEKHGGMVDLYDISPEITVAGVQELGLIEKAIVELPPKWRKAFVFSRFGHLSYKEIAQKMGVTTRTVENYMSNALTKLRSTISRATGEER